MSEFTLRVAAGKDADAVSALLAASYAALLPGHYPTEILAVALPLMTTANPALLTCGTYYVAETAEGEAIACGGWTLERPGSGETENGLGHIRHFATHPNWAGKGAGRALLARCIADAEARTIHTLECYSTLNAEGFYAAGGFRRLATIEVSFTPEVKFPAIRMMRN